MTGHERYAIPRSTWKSCCASRPIQVKDRIERVGDAEVVRLRGNLLP
jgi:two-component system chemotaxis sensor kinase CheA